MGRATRAEEHKAETQRQQEKPPFGFVDIREPARVGNAVLKVVLVVRAIVVPSISPNIW